MYDEAEELEFETREIFRIWLEKNHNKSKGIWIIFKKRNKAFTTNDALEEAICFGWIDGLIKSINENSYKKYFSMRKSTTKWSDKNIVIFNDLKEKGLLSDSGLKAFKKEGNNRMSINLTTKNGKNIEVLSRILIDDAEAFRLFKETPPSRQKQLAGFYCDAKTEETRKRRVQKIIEALKTNYKGMLY